MVRERFDYNLLDPEEPFEVDTQLAHLFKHEGMSVDDIYDVFFSDPQFVPAKPPADWLMVAQVPGGAVLCVPLAPARSGAYNQARPIGVYDAPVWLRDMYLEER
jgi:hypothetical protein